MSLDLSPGIYHGALIEAVEAEGTGLLGDHTAGAAVLNVASGGFSVVGKCSVLGNTYDYVREDASLAISPVLVADAEDGTPVIALTPDGQPETRKMAVFDLDMIGEDDETGEEDPNYPRAVIPGEWAGYYQVGTYPSGTFIDVEDTTYGYRVKGRPHDAPPLDGASVDASTLDTSTMPGVPGGQKFSVDAPTELDVDYPADYGWWQVVDGEVVGFWRLIAGAWTTQDIVTAEALVAKNAIIDALTGKTITGTTVQTRDAQDRGIKLGRVEGSTNYDEAFIVFNESGVPFIKAVPAEALAVIAGEIKANSITVAPTSTEEGTSLGGVTEVTRHTDGSAGVLRLTGYTTAPKSAPTVTTGYDTVQFDNDGLWGSRHGWTTDGAHWYTVRQDDSAGSTRFAAEKWSLAGALEDTTGFLTGSPRGGVVHGANLYELITSPAGWSQVYVRSLTTFALTATYDWDGYDAGGGDPALGVDASGSGYLLIAQSVAANAGKVQIERYPLPLPLPSTGALPPVTTLDTDFAYNRDLAGLTYGTHDLGANRYIFTSDESHGYRVTNASGAAQTAEDWEAGMAAKVGFTYTGGAFVSMDTTGLMRTYTGEGKALAIGHANLTKYVSNTLANATYETTQSPRAKITIPKRTKLNVTTSAINTGGTNAPDRVKIYVGQNTATPAADPTNTNMIKQTDPAVGVITKSYSSIATSPDTNPPTTNGFAAAAGTVQQIQLADESVLVDGVGGPAWTAYTPTFTASVTNPTLANFTISGRYALLPRNTVAFVALFTCNTAANMGSGNYQFGLPVAARATNEVVCIAQQSGPNHGYQGRGASTTTINLFLTSTDAVATVTSTGMAAATSIRITGTYERA